MFKWKVMPFGVANAPALFKELMNKIWSILRQRPKVQELISRGAQMEAHIDDVCLGTNTQEDHLIQIRTQARYRRNRLTEPKPNYKSNPSHTPKPLTLDS